MRNAAILRGSGLRWDLPDHRGHWGRSATGCSPQRCIRDRTEVPYTGDLALSPGDSPIPMRWFAISHGVRSGNATGRVAGSCGSQCFQARERYTRAVLCNVGENNRTVPVPVKCRTQGTGKIDPQPRKCVRMSLLLLTLLCRGMATYSIPSSRVSSGARAGNPFVGESR